mmetsp:Transcript_5437/g.7339  ORF Transcript_5437/g.7339 Transcript_5437/m.7339 type:complete len:105 (-) Transcript_5437:215-529(-)|eukprot:CAMPEP_0116063978 /NCGR_PEP_ID=MMETSP0322-20121206/8795_1 /TAXON_ID=163516 /ORGANISM="Leptocylindrus danicus var. apora, Strain B651" /LENGTH=104 /DNA_ID=CAMNT_0003549817 /DNA_START=144 /DNA_END=458 /DNA_ORIENTATION=+
MKITSIASSLLFASSITGAAAFTFVASSSRSSATKVFGERKNTKVDLDSPKVATMESIGAGEKKVYCRCWESGTFPLCDGAHMAHNKENGDNVGPLIVSVPKED